MKYDRFKIVPDEYLSNIYNIVDESDCDKPMIMGFETIEGAVEHIDQLLIEENEQ